MYLKFEIWGKMWSERVSSLQFSLVLQSNESILPHSTDFGQIYYIFSKKLNILCFVFFD